MMCKMPKFRSPETCPHTNIPFYNTSHYPLSTRTQPYLSTILLRSAVSSKAPVSHLSLWLWGLWGVRKIIVWSPLHFYSLFWAWLNKVDPLRGEIFLVTLNLPRTQYSWFRHRCVGSLVVRYENVVIGSMHPRYMMIWTIPSDGTIPKLFASSSIF